MFLEGVNIWIAELRKAEGPPQRACASPNPLRAWLERKGRRRVNACSLWFIWEIYLLLPFCPQTGALVVLRLTTSAHVLETFELELNNTTGSPRSLAHRWQTVGLLSLAAARAKSWSWPLYIYMYPIDCYSRAFWLIYRVWNRREIKEAYGEEESFRKRER